MDVKLAYLHPTIKEETHFEQPQILKKPNEKGNKLDCRLRKSIHGSKQAPKNWHEEMATFFKQQNFNRSKNNYCIFSEIENDRKLIVLSWVDDLVIAGSKAQDIEVLKKTFEEWFKMDYRGKLEWFPGMQISQKVDYLNLDQGVYMVVVIEKFSMQNSNASKVAAQNNLRLVKAIEDEHLVDATLNRSL